MAGGPTQLIRENCGLATAVYDGLMSAADKAKLNGATSFRRTIVGGDGADFTVTLPVAQPDSNYVVTWMLMSDVPFNSIKIPFANQTATTFRVITDGTFDVGVILGFTVTRS